jgi:putative flippase GtrA
MTTPWPRCVTLVLTTDDRVVSQRRDDGPAHGLLGARVFSWAADIVRRLWREMVGFGAVGLVGVSCDIGAFNLIFVTFHTQVFASVGGTSLGTLIGYLGNRYWVFRNRDLRQSAAEITLYLLVSGGGILITAGAVAFNDYVLGFKSQLSANLAQFLVGQALGTVFRFWAMNKWVFPEARPVRAEAVLPAGVAGTVQPQLADAE